MTAKIPTLAELLEFPCEYTFKAFGSQGAADDFVQTVHQAVSVVLPVPLAALQVRASSGGAYVCVSVPVRLENLAQLQLIYTALQQVAGLKYLL